MSKKAEIKTVLFDLDGTLVDTIPSWNIAYEAAFNYFGIQLTQEQFVALHGMSLTQVATYMGLTSSEQESKLRSIRDEKYMSLIKDITWKKFTTEILTKVLESGYNIALITSSWRKFVDALKLTPGLTSFFDVIVTADDTKRHKPHPDPFFVALEALNANPEECIYVGDHECDIIGSRKAGIKNILLHKDEWNKTQPDHKITCISELHEILSTFHL